MNDTQQPLEFSIDWYREKAKSDPHIAALVGFIDRQGAQLVQALEAAIELHAQLKAEKKAREAA